MKYRSSIVNVTFVQARSIKRIFVMMWLGKSSICKESRISQKITFHLAHVIKMDTTYHNI